MKTFKRTFFIWTIIFAAYSCSSYSLGEFKAKSIIYTTTDSVIQKLKNKSNILLILSTEKNRSQIKKSLIFSLQKKKWFKIYYEDKGFRNEEYKTFTLEEKSISKKTGDSVLNVFITNKFWEIKDFDYGCDEIQLKNDKKNSTDRCGTIHDGETSVLTFLFENRAVTKKYYSPDYYLCCEGFEDRKIFLECKNAVLVSAE